MSILNIIKHPTFNLHLPLSKQDITFRGFLVQEQKLLMMASESESKEDIDNAIKQILRNCIITNIDIDSLSLVEIQFIYLNIQARSDSNIVKNTYRCERTVNDEICGGHVTTEIDLLQLEIKESDNSNLMQLDEDVYIKLKYPEYNILNKITNLDSLTDTAYTAIATCIECISHGDTVYYSKDISLNEMMLFINSLTKQQFKMISDFFENLPKIETTVEGICDKCGYKHIIDVTEFDHLFF